jgi:hypothetical protein
MIRTQIQLPDALHKQWQMPTPRKLGSVDPFTDEAWRMNLHCGALSEDAENKGVSNFKEE